MSSSLIHPDIRGQVYLGSAALVLSAAALPFTSSEPIKIIANTTISGFGTMLISYMVAYPGEKEIQYLSTSGEQRLETTEDRLIRSAKPLFNHFWLSVRMSGLFALAGCALACAAKAPFPRLTEKMSEAKLRVVYPISSVSTLAFLFCARLECGAPRCSSDSESFLYASLSAGLLSFGIFGPLAIIARRLSLS